MLAFAVRTLGQMLEDGQLDELVQQQRSQHLGVGAGMVAAVMVAVGEGAVLTTNAQAAGPGSRLIPCSPSNHRLLNRTRADARPADATADVDTAAVGEAPTQQEPATEQPVSEEAVTEQPVTEQPAEEPKSDEDPKPAEA